MTINEMKQSYKQSYTDNVELSIFNCGREQCQPGHTWGPGVRDHYLIHLVVAGKGVYQVNGASHTLQEGDLFLAKPNQLITYAADETDPWEYYWVGFNGACANKLVQQTPFSEAHPVHHCRDLQTAREALYNIYLSRGPEPHCEAMMTGYLYIFMAHLMKEAREAMPNVGSSSSMCWLPSSLSSSTTRTTSRWTTLPRRSASAAAICIVFSCRMSGKAPSTT